MSERRRYHRHQVYRPARFIGGGNAFDCVVRDLSVNGARLAMVSTAGIADTIELSFDGLHTVRPCRVVWRSSTELGVEFKERTFHRAA